MNRFARAPRIAIAIGMASLLGSPAPALDRPNGGSISIEQAADGGDPAAMRPFVEALSEALAARGFTILEDLGHSAYVAELGLTRVEVGTGSARVPKGQRAMTPGAAGSAGVGVVIPLSSAKSELVPLQRIRLDLSIRKRGAAVLWHGAAVTVRTAGRGKGTDERVATDLAQAVLRSYPAESEAVVGVP